MYLLFCLTLSVPPRTLVSLSRLLRLDCLSVCEWLFSSAGALPALSDPRRVPPAVSESRAAVGPPPPPPPPPGGT